MAKQIIIYVPDITMADVLAAIIKRYPDCKVVTRWEPGAIMWQNAIK